MKFNVESFLVLDGHAPSLRELKKNGIFVYTVTDARIYPLETVIPIIRKGEGCIGLATIKRFSVSVNSTTIEFDVAKCSDSSAKAYYDLYRNSISMGNDDDDYDDDEDSLIPGLGISKPKPRSSYGSPSSKPRPKGWS